MSIRKVVAAMSHHSWDNSKSVASLPTVTYSDACTQTVPVADSKTLALVNEYIAPAPAIDLCSVQSTVISCPHRDNNSHY